MKTAIVTLAAGSAMQPIAKLSLPLIMRYANRIGSDFISLSPVYSNRFLGILNYEKFQILDLLKTYDRVAFIDADTLVSPRAPSLFEVVDKDQLGVFIASRHSDGHNPSVEAIQAALGEIHWEREHRNKEIYVSFNSGVMVLSRQIRKAFCRDFHLAEKWASFDSQCYFMSDQPLWNYISQKHQLPVQDISYKFNHTLAPANSERRFSSHIIHYAGSSHRETNLFKRPSKATKMKHDSLIICSRTLYRLAMRYPSIVSFVDRVF